MGPRDHRDGRMKTPRGTNLKERDAAEKKLQDRAREDFNYSFKREQLAIMDKLNDGRAALEKDIKLRRETLATP